MNKLVVGCIVLGRLETNCYYLYREGGSEAIVVDPPLHADQIHVTLMEKGLIVKAILLTHGHFDHIMGVNELKEICEGATVYASKKEIPLLTDPSLNHSRLIGKEYKVNADVLLSDGDEAEISGMKFRMIETPGHSVGSCCYYFEEDNVLISGDTLFFESVGRTDFPTGSAGDLRTSISEKLWKLPNDTAVYPGHGDFTSIGHEKEYNPYCCELQ